MLLSECFFGALQGTSSEELEREGAGLPLTCSSVYWLWLPLVSPSRLNALVVVLSCLVLFFADLGGLLCFSSSRW